MQEEMVEEDRKIEADLTSEIRWVKLWLERGDLAREFDAHSPIRALTSAHVPP